MPASLDLVPRLTSEKARRLRSFDRRHRSLLEHEFALCFDGSHRSEFVRRQHLNYGLALTSCVCGGEFSPDRSIRIWQYGMIVSQRRRD
ncbi:uncharacterized protein CC84DRAFT_809868 [Paraphaeosphaeria sporulosa]|uniref:Uncharacterized protein n=1 Tax=Paraphaeosphaeria sporulosa TaxID=1460663 RepID=A0A177CDT6_9PLEO|nr:uncharacterized protein CC84DRAFT_809868 [Paraphaeosphaeria sporulosa]OAG04938.1 hypothetical protein CC84DRAFT_809868 [Paraphaeosphaeria sporulosa]